MPRIRVSVMPEWLQSLVVPLIIFGLACLAAGGAVINRLREKTARQEAIVEQIEKRLDKRD